MKEYLTPAIVLRTGPRGEFDRFVDLYTRNFGRIGARVVGGRRILSKLTPHLSVMSVANVRLVQKGGFTVTDALAQSGYSAFKKNIGQFSKFQDLIFLIREMAPKGLADLRLWHEFLRSFQTTRINFRIFLKLLGYDPVIASCELCGRGKVDYFYVGDQSFLCVKCSGQIPKNKLILIT